MRKLPLLLVFLAAASLAQTDTPTPSLTPTVTRTPTITPTPTRTPPPPQTTQIHGLTPADNVVGIDEFVIDKDIAGVWRTRKATALQILEYLEASNLTFTGTITLEGIVILPNGSTPPPGDCDGAPEEDGRIFIDTANSSGKPQVCVCNGVSGWVCTTAFGDTIDDTELTAEDFGSFTCTGSEDGCTLDDGSVVTAKILDSTILEADLNVTNSPTSAFCLTSNGTTGFTWAPCASGSLEAPGNTGEVLFNTADLIAADPGLTYNPATDTLTVAGAFVGPNVTSGANPGHTHTETSVFSDRIVASDSSVQVFPGLGQVIVTLDGAAQYEFQPTLMGVAAADGPVFDGIVAPSATNPSIVPNRAAMDDGIGYAGGSLVLIESGVEVLRATAGTVLIGEGFESDLEIDDRGDLRFRETDANGDNYVGFNPPAAITTNRICDLEDDANFIPDSCVGNGTDNVDGGAAATAVALAANGANCTSGNYPLGVDASGAVETCTADDDVPELGDFAAGTDLDANGAVDTNSVALGTDTTNNYVATIADSGNTTVTVANSGSESAAVTLNVVDVNCTACLSATELGADSVSASELDEAGVEASLEAVIDLADLSGDLPLTTKTSGNYVATVADDGQSTLTVNNSGSEGSAITARVIDVVCTDCLGSTEVAALADGDISDTLTASISTTASVGDNDTSIATTAFVQASHAQSMQVLTSGTGTYTVTSGTQFVLAICVGGGGGTPAETVADAAVSGGGGGGAAIKLFTAAAITGQTYLVGATSTTTGNTSGLGTANALLQATGGAVGVSTGLTTTVGVGARGGLGGIGTLGDLNIRGGSGGRGTVYSAANSEGGNGGDSLLGGGGRGGSTTGSQVGEAGGAYGGGAGGGEVSDDTNIAAGTGAAGVCYMLEYK